MVANGQERPIFPHAGELLEVNYSLNNKEYISVFIVYSLGGETGYLISGLWGDYRSGNYRSIFLKYLRNSRRELVINSGNEKNNSY